MEILKHLILVLLNATVFYFLFFNTNYSLHIIKIATYYIIYKFFENLLSILITLYLSMLKK